MSFVKSLLNLINHLVEVLLEIKCAPPYLSQVFVDLLEAPNTSPQLRHLPVLLNASSSPRVSDQVGQINFVWLHYKWVHLVFFNYFLDLNFLSSSDQIRPV